MKRTVKITNNGPETLIIALRKQGAVHEVYYPQIVLNVNDSTVVEMDDIRTSILISQIDIESSQQQQIDQPIGLGGGLSVGLPSIGGLDNPSTPTVTAAPTIDEVIPAESIDTYVWSNGKLTVFKN